MDNQQTEGADLVSVWCLRPLEGENVFLAVAVDPADLAEEGRKQSQRFWDGMDPVERALEWPDGPLDCLSGCVPVHLSGARRAVGRALSDMTGLELADCLEELEKCPKDVEHGGALGAAILAMGPLAPSELRTLTGLLQTLVGWPPADRLAFLTDTAAALRVSG